MSNKKLECEIKDKLVNDSHTKQINKIEKAKVNWKNKQT